MTTKALNIVNNTPTWEATLWACLDVIENGDNPEAKLNMRKELVRMARLADKLVAQDK